MTNECPGCGRYNPAYIRECKCGHKFVADPDRVGKEPRRVTIAGYELKCNHCGGNAFTGREALLNTAGMTFLDLEWLNASAEVLVCSRCGRLEWFLDPQLLIVDDAQT
jgi:hypothetical protein